MKIKPNNNKVVATDKQKYGTIFFKYLTTLPKFDEFIKTKTIKKREIKLFNYFYENNFTQVLANKTWCMEAVDALEHLTDIKKKSIVFYLSQEGIYLHELFLSFGFGFKMYYNYDSWDDSYNSTDGRIIFLIWRLEEKVGVKKD